MFNLADRVRAPGNDIRISHPLGISQCNVMMGESVTWILTIEYITTEKNQMQTVQYRISSSR